MSDIDWLNIIKWVLIVLIAGFIGQFGKMLADHIAARVRMKRPSSLGGPSDRVHPEPSVKGTGRDGAVAPSGDLPPDEPPLSVSLPRSEPAKMDKKALKAIEKERKKEVKFRER
jgi:hypothetical protein